MAEEEIAFPLAARNGWTKRRAVFLSVSSLLALALLVAVREVLLPFLLGLVIAYVLTPLVQFGETRLRMPRSLSIIVVYVVVVGTISLTVAGIAPRIYEESVAFVRDVPSLTHRVAEEQGPRIERWLNAYQPKDLPTQGEAQPHSFTIHEVEGGLAVQLGEGLHIVEQEKGHWRVMAGDGGELKNLKVSQLVDQGITKFIRYVRLNALQFLKLGQSIITSASRFVLLSFMTLMVAGYVMHTRESIVSFFRSLIPQVHRAGFNFLLKRVDRGLSGVVRGQLLICLVNGVLSAVGFALLGLKYWPVLALLAAVMSIIPIFGSILSTVPAVLIGLTQDPWTALWVLVWILAIHQVEANFLNPKIIGSAAKIHPVLVVFALLVGEHYFGLWGALLAVPTLSVTQSIFNHFRYNLPDAQTDSLRVPEVAVD